MKLIIASDIHGSAYYCRKLIDKINEQKPDRVLLLGDLLYHGPRNDLPKEYAPKAVIEMLNGIKENLLCVRGNCEAEVDQMVLDFPVMADYAVIPTDSALIYATHGHTHSETTPPPLVSGDILLGGHTHIPKCSEYENFTYLNPGSVSIPKENSPHSYILFDGKQFNWINLETDEVYMQYSL